MTGHNHKPSASFPLFYWPFFLVSSLVVKSAAFVPLTRHQIPSPAVQHLSGALQATLSPPQDELQERYNTSDGSLGDVPIPVTGVSIQDEMASSQKDRFDTELVPIKGFALVAAQIITTTSATGSFEPVRYLVSLTKLSPEEEAAAASGAPLQPEQQPAGNRTFVLMDIPPFSPSLVAEMKEFMGKGSRLAAILVTNRDGIHYDEAPAVYRMRRTDLEYWKQAFPGLAIVAYRLDIPRDCRESMTQVLDGYGPFALSDDDDNKNFSFVETGRPLTFNEWDHDVAQDILRGRRPVDYRNGGEDHRAASQEADYSKGSIRAKEENKQILAVYTPGHSFGSMSYIFPETGLCCSGYTLPVEDTRDEENIGMDSTGPALDCRGYITTSRGGVAKQMESARHLVHNYCARFHVVMPSRGDPLVLSGDTSEKKEVLLDVLDQYERIGKIYEQLGITYPND